MRIECKSVEVKMITETSVYSFEIVLVIFSMQQIFERRNRHSGVQGSDISSTAQQV